ncbi:hypothetical protein EJB05_11563, partial [Eragrostis curvula]
MASSDNPATVGTKKTGNFKFAFTCAIFASMACIILGYGTDIIFCSRLAVISSILLSKSLSDVCLCTEYPADIGVMSGAAIYIKKDLKITDVQLEVLMGILNLYSLIGAFAAGRTSDWIGRRFTVVFAAAIFFTGALIMGFAVNYAMLMAGRFVAGVGVGYAVMIAPVYTAEISSASARGFLTSFPDVFINFGILLGYVSNYAFARLPLHLGWRVMLGIGAAPSVLLAFMVFVMPESPRWLVMKGRLADARAVLEQATDTPEEAAQRLDDIKAAAGIPRDLDGDVVTVPKKQRTEEMQASGCDSVVLYSPRVFKTAGITDDNQLLGATCAVGATKTLTILIATFLLDRVGRRPLAMTSTAGMAVSLVGLGTGLTVVGHHPDARITWAIALCIASTLAFVSFFSIGLGPIAGVYTSEIFPLRVRALGFACGVACNRVTSGVVTMTFLSLSNAITIGGSFYLYAGIAALGWVFFFTCLPETRGRTLESMGKLFGMDETDSMAEAAEDQAATKEKAGEMPAN